MLFTLRLTSRLNYGVQIIRNSNQHLLDKTVKKSWIPVQLPLSQYRTIHQTNQLQSEEDDYYSILRLNKNATPDEIRAAYFQLSKEYSPFRSENMMESAKMLQRINRAFTVLNDTERRKMYDFAIGTVEQKRWNFNQEYNQSTEDFADEREAAYKLNQTKNQLESRFQYYKSKDKARISKDDVNENESSSEHEDTGKKVTILIGSLFIVYCFSEIYRYFEEKKFAKMVEKNVESKMKNLE